LEINEGENKYFSYNYKESKLDTFEDAGFFRLFNNIVFNILNTIIKDLDSLFAKSIEKS